MASSIIPNSFQLPNFYVDKLAFYLTAEEIAVLQMAAREILGWQNRICSRSARVSLSVFSSGKTNEQGEVLCNGLGFNRSAIIRALKALDEFNILVKEGSNQKGRLLRLQDQEDQIDWDGLKERARDLSASSKKRTEQAIKARRKGCTSDVTSTSDNTGDRNGATTTTRNGTITKGSMPDVHKETHIETQNRNTKGKHNSQVRRELAPSSPQSNGNTSNGKSNGFVPENEIPIKNPKPGLTNEHLECGAIFKQLLIDNGLVPKDGNRVVLAEGFRLLNLKDKVPVKSIMEVLNWYKDNISKPYVPKADRSAKFREKWNSIKQAMDNNGYEKPNGNRFAPDVSGADRFIQKLKDGNGQEEEYDPSAGLEKFREGLRREMKHA